MVATKEQIDQAKDSFSMILVEELSSSKNIFRAHIEWCYEAHIGQYCIFHPEIKIVSKSEVVDKVLEIFERTRIYERE